MTKRKDIKDDLDDTAEERDDWGDMEEEEGEGWEDMVEHFTDY